MQVRHFFHLTSWSKSFKECMWKYWYQRLAKQYPESDWRFMNYGYAPLHDSFELKLNNQEDELNRLFIQLYAYVLKGLEIEGKQVLEVGSGRGGGADFVARYFLPASLTGLDYSSKNVELSKKFHHAPGLKFVEGNAEKLPFSDHSFDVVYNVESSHCYGNMRSFISEVARVLKPGGYFAWADLRLKDEMQELEELTALSNLKVISKENITANVIHALDLIADFKTKSIKEKVPYLMRNIFSEFAGVPKSKIYEGFKDGTVVYWVYQFQKPVC